MAPSRCRFGSPWGVNASAWPYIGLPSLEWLEKMGERHRVQDFAPRPLASGVTDNDHVIGSDLRIESVARADLLNIEDGAGALAVDLAEHDHVVERGKLRFALRQRQRAKQCRRALDRIDPGFDDLALHGDLLSHRL